MKTSTLQCECDISAQTAGSVCLCVCVCVCVYVCVPAWVCVCIFFPPYGCDLVICYSMLAYSHTSGFAPLCGFLVCVDKVFSGSGQHLVCVFFFCSVFFFFFAPVQSSGVLSSLSVLFGPVTLANRPRFDLLQHPVSDWPLDPAKRGCVCLARCEYAQRYRGEARTQMRPPEVGAEDI